MNNWKKILVLITCCGGIAACAPNLKSTKWEERREAVRSLTTNDQVTLETVALADSDRDVRVAAVERLTNQSVLTKIATNDSDALVRSAAVEKINDQSLLLKVVVGSHDETRLKARAKLNDEGMRQLDTIDYRNANSQNTIAKYDEYISNFPTGKHLSEAQANLRKLKFEAAKSSKTAVAYEEFLSKYPKGEDSTAIINSLSELRKWQQAKVLGEALTRISLKAAIVDQMFAGWAKKESFEELKIRSMQEIREALKSGADPNSVRIKGFVPPGKKTLPNGDTMHDSGNSGAPVPSSEGGISLLEYCKANKLDEAHKELMAFGAK